MSKQYKNLQLSLEQLADITDAELIGCAQAKEAKITNIATLALAKIDSISFFTNNAYKKDLLQTKAGVVILPKKLKDLVEKLTCAVLLVDNAHLSYAKLTGLFNSVSVDNYQKNQCPDTLNIHSTAVIGKDCQIAESVVLGPYVVIGNNVEIADNVVINANTNISNNVKILANTFIYSGVNIYTNTVIGTNCIIHSGVVIGADGFGFSPDASANWHKVEQLGGVTIGNNVEIGANTTIDCGAIENTVIANGVKLDNQIQIGHNVFIDENSIIAANAAIAGSVKIGKRCAFGGSCSIAGHIEIADDVSLAGTGAFGQSVTEKGFYASGTGHAMPFRQWRRMTVNIYNLDKFFKKVKEISKSVLWKEN